MIYGFLLQNTTSHKTYVYNVDVDDTSRLYYKFDLAVGDQVADGEYEWILFENPDALPILVNVNNPYASKHPGSDPVILVTYADTLTNGTDILVVKEGQQEGRIEIVATGLADVGERKKEKMTYNTQRTYTTYGTKNS